MVGACTHLDIKENMYNFLYKTINKKNGKAYIGVHSSNINPMEKFDGYLGSGHVLKKAIKKYGKKSFHREILIICESAEYAYLLEEKLVNDDFIRQKDNYNVVVGGKGGYIGSHLYDDPEHKKNASERAKKQNQKFIDDYGKDAMSERMKHVAAGCTEESRKHGAEKLKKKYNDPEFVKKKKESAQRAWEKEDSNERRKQVSKQSKDYWENLSQEEYDKICADRKNRTNGMMSAYNILTGENVRVSKEEYNADDNLVNHSSKVARKNKALRAKNRKE